MTDRSARAHLDAIRETLGSLRRNIQEAQARLQVAADDLNEFRRPGASATQPRVLGMDGLAVDQDVARLHQLLTYASAHGITEEDLKKVWFQ